jgi:predicted dehydrogenase
MLLNSLSSSRPGVTRREFIKTAAAAGALGLTILPNGLASEAPMKERIPIGFLGATYSHGPDKIRLTMRSPDWEFVGVCDITEAGRAICRGLDAKLVTRQQLFEQARVVAVESDVPQHAEHALLALQAGKHIHLEKPPAMKLGDMRELVAVARKKNLLLQTGFMWRYHPGFDAIVEAARKGWLGEVFLVRGYISNNLPPERRLEWAEFAGGSMFELGSHLVDATVRLLGKPRHVTPFLRHHGAFADSLKDNNVAVLEYDKITAVLVNTALQAGGTPQRSFEVLGTNGTATLQPIEPPTLVMDLGTPAGPCQKGKQRVPMPPYQRYEGDFVELAAAVRGERPLKVSLDDELLVAETVLKVSDML